MPLIKDITNQRFGKLVALECTNIKDRWGSYKWKCICDCGEPHIAASNLLKCGNIRSCGCLKKGFAKVVNNKKFCKKCNLEKNIKDFYLRKKSKTPRTNCKKCEVVEKKEWALKNKEKFLKHKQTYYKKHIEKNRNRLLIKNYGLTLEQYQQLLISQNYTCAICKQFEVTKNKPMNEIKALSVDHCHKTGKVRGLLCQKCNKGIGLLQDNTEYLQNAITYLKETE